MSDAEHTRSGPGMSLGLGVLATLLGGALGACGWLAWVWSRTPEEVRATVSPAKRRAVVAVGLLSLAANGLGLVMTALALRRAFESVDHVEASDKARFLAEGISSAMNWTMLGLLPMPVLVLVVFVAGYRLLRAGPASGEQRRA